MLRFIWGELMVRRNKYGSIKTVVDGITFDSRKEAARYGDLQLLEKHGAITDLELQPKFDCVVNGKKVCTYKADFAYTLNGERVVEDVKSIITQRNHTYRIKKKLVEALFGVEISEFTG